VIVGMHIGGISIHCIAVVLGMLNYTIFIVSKNFQDRGALQLLKSSGRPPNLNICDKRMLGRILCEN